MNIVLENWRLEKHDITLRFTQEFQGRGGWNINCDVVYLDNKKRFVHYTTDSQFIDIISDLRADNTSSNIIQETYYKRFFDELEERVREWVAWIAEDNEK